MGIKDSHCTLGFRLLTSDGSKSADLLGKRFVMKVVIGLVIELYIKSNLLRINLRAVQQLSAHGYVQEHTGIYIYIYIYSKLEIMYGTL